MNKLKCLLHPIKVSYIKLIRQCSKINEIESIYRTDGTKYNYNEVLHKSILFFESARAGVLPKSNRIPWRGDSSLKDGCDIGVDLSGGWYDGKSILVQILKTICRLDVWNCDDICS